MSLELTTVDTTLRFKADNGDVNIYQGKVSVEDTANTPNQIKIDNSKIQYVNRPWVKSRSTPPS